MDERSYTSLSIQHNQFALSLLTCDREQLAISHAHIFLLPQTSIRRWRHESDSHWHAQVNNPRALEERAPRGNGRSTREMHFVDFANKRAGILFKIVDCLNHPDLCAPRCPRPQPPQSPPLHPPRTFSACLFAPITKRCQRGCQRCAKDCGAQPDVWLFDHSRHTRAEKPPWISTHFGDNVLVSFKC